MKLVRWFIGIFGGILATLWIVTAAASRTPRIQALVVTALNAQLGTEVELQSFQVYTFPRISIYGDGLRLRLKGQPDQRPLIEVAHFAVEGSIWAWMRRPRRVHTLRLDGLRITIPPGGVHNQGRGSRLSGEPGSPEGPVVVEHLESTDAQLVLVPSEAGKEPKVFAIHQLSLDSVGFNRAMPFRATLTNPIPRGLINTAGTFGPWRAAEPGASPVKGTYEFQHADLSTIHGLGGILSSTGQFDGVLAKIDVQGTTTTPDFSIDVAGQPLPLETRFHALVNGTDGNTYLYDVQAKLAETAFTTRGAIIGRPGIKGRFVTLDVTMEAGRVEDVLKLAMKSGKPPLAGVLSLRNTLVLPPGEKRVVDRLQLDGDFALRHAHFTNPDVEEKLRGLSRRSQGKKAVEPVGRVASNFAGKFSLRNAVIRFSPVRFTIPGAVVELRGGYGLRSQRLDFEGALSMRATISQAAGGGVKGFLLKVFDPLFKKNGAGAFIPIHVRGTRNKPEFGIDVKRVLHAK